MKEEGENRAGRPETGPVSGGAKPALGELWGKARLWRAAPGPPKGFALAPPKPRKARGLPESWGPCCSVTTVISSHEVKAV